MAAPPYQPLSRACSWGPGRRPEGPSLAETPFFTPFSQLSCCIQQRRWEGWSLWNTRTAGAHCKQCKTRWETGNFMILEFSLRHSKPLLNGIISLQLILFKRHFQFVKVAFCVVQKEQESHCRSVVFSLRSLIERKLFLKRWSEKSSGCWVHNLFPPTWHRMTFWEQTTSRLHSNFLQIFSLME